METLSPPNKQPPPGTRRLMHGIPRSTRVEDQYHETGDAAMLVLHPPPGRVKTQKVRRHPPFFVYVASWDRDSEAALLGGRAERVIAVGTACAHLTL